MLSWRNVQVGVPLDKNVYALANIAVDVEDSILAFVEKVRQAPSCPRSRATFRLF
jgi:hypothetical protein